MDAAELHFKGLDTYADVYLNGHKILEADNMFIGWEVNCLEYLHEGDNELHIYFHSPFFDLLPGKKKSVQIITAKDINDHSEITMVSLNDL